MVAGVHVDWYCDVGFAEVTARDCTAIIRARFRYGRYQEFVTPIREFP
jgi:hypothetical protein